MRAFRNAVLLVSLTLGAVAAAPAPVPTWTGKTVFVRQEGLYAVDNPRSETPRKVARLTYLNYKVLDDKDGWVKLRDKTVEGWVQKTDLVPGEEAVAFFTKRIEANPKDINAYMARSAALQKKQDIDGALKDLSEALRIRPEAAACWLNRGLLWAAKQKADEAIKDYDEALRLDPRHVVALNARGNAWASKRMHGRAIEDYSAAIRISPTFWSPYRGRGRGWAATGQPDRAIADFNEALRLNPRDASCYIDRGRAWATKKDFEKALADYDQGIKIDRQSKLGYHHRAAAWKAKKDYAKALKDYEEAGFLDSNYAPALNGRAAILACCPDDRIRDGKKAVELATRACELTMWKSAPYLTVLASAHAEAGAFDEALRWQKKALEDKKYAARFDKNLQERLKRYEAKKPYREE